MIIKLFLLAGIALAAALAYRTAPSARTLALRRILAVAVGLAAGTAILEPDLVTALANRVGVGRGTDLVVYLLVVASLFTWLGLQRRLHELERRLTKLARSAALDAHQRVGSEKSTAVGTRESPDSAP